MQTKLTKSNISTKILDQLALETGGLLGSYTLEEYEDLSSVDIAGWDLIFTPSKFNPSEGLLKLRPKSGISLMWLNRGRTMAILREFPDDVDLDIDHVGTFVSYIKGLRELNRPKIRSFLIKHRHALREACTDSGVDYAKVRKVCITNHIFLTAELSTALIQHVPNIVACLYGEKTTADFKVE